jgi:uncharacterized protein YjbI with pentapeptide repeats
VAVRRLAAKRKANVLVLPSFDLTEDLRFDTPAKIQAAHRTLRLRARDLRGAVLNNADLRLVELDYAHLQGARLNNTSLQGASLSSADLRGPSLSDAHLQGAFLWGPIYGARGSLPPI